MAEDPNSPLNQALAGLGTTINTITDKVEAGKTRVREYKAQIIAKLREVVEQLNSLKANNNLKALPQLRKQLQDSQASLQQKTEELDQTKGQLVEANQNLQQLQQNLDQINRQIEEKNQQITDLTNSGNQKDKAIQELDAQVRELDKQKEEAEKNLASAQQQIDSIIQKIGELNTKLVSQIQLIDTIANELGDINNGDVSEEFRAVTDNIKIIVDMLNSAGQGDGGAEGRPESRPEAVAVQQPEYNVEQNFNRLKELSSADKNGRKLIQFTKTIKDPRIEADLLVYNRQNDPAGIAALKKLLSDNKINVPPVMNGGKSRRHKRRGGRKTMKKKHRKTRKLAKKNYRGGYVYSASKDLDKASSVISASSSSKSSSGKRDKTRRK
jgi:DNA repair exonuclease SbcCD ATPase subunit